MLAPLLSEYDPEVASEAALDPLGTYPAANALAGILVPGVRERMSHPRFRTLIAVSFAVRSESTSEHLAVKPTPSCSTFPRLAMSAVS